jgi:Flp pilus assembly protein CpaB
VDNQWRYSLAAAYALGTMKLKVLTFIIQFRRELAAVCAALAMLSAINVVKPSSPTTILAAANNMPAGHVISASDLKVLPVTASWPSAFRNATDLTGQTISHAIDAGTPINHSDLLAHALASTFDARHKAVTVEISPTDATIATIGSRVDVFSATGEQISSRSLVLATSTPANNSFSIGASQTVAVVLNMNDSEISQLARAKSGGTLTLAATTN